MEDSRKKHKELMSDVIKETRKKEALILKSLVLMVQSSGGVFGGKRHLLGVLGEDGKTKSEKMYR